MDPIPESDHTSLDDTTEIARWLHESGGPGEYLVEVVPATGRLHATHTESGSHFATGLTEVCTAPQAVALQLLSVLSPHDVEKITIHGS